MSAPAHFWPVITSMPARSWSNIAARPARYWASAITDMDSWPKEINRSIRLPSMRSGAVPGRADCGTPGTARTRRAAALVSKRRTISSTTCAPPVGCRSRNADDRHATGHHPYTGIPSFSTTFGRSGLIAALQMRCWWSRDVGRRETSCPKFNRTREMKRHWRYRILVT